MKLKLDTHLSKEILKIAYPPMIGFLGIILFDIADVWWIGKLGQKAVAGCAGAFFIIWIIYSISLVTTVGCATLISQFYGAGKKDRIFDVGREAHWLTLFIAIFLVIIFWIGGPYFFIWMGLDKEASKFALDYFRITTLGLPLIFIYTLHRYIFNPHGDTRTSTVILLISVLVNFILDPFLIFGWGFFPKMGTAGASLASIIGYAVAVVIGFYLLRKKNYISPLKDLRKISFCYARKLFDIGVPSALTNLTWSIIFPFLTIIVTKFGMAPLAALNIGHRLEGFPYFMGMGFSIAMSTLIGQSFGAGNKEKVYKLFIHGVALISLFLLPIIIGFVFFPELLLGLLNNDPEVIRHGSQYIRIIGYLELFLGWELVIEGAFNGLGNTTPYMKIRIPLTLARVPFAYLLAFNLGMGIDGIWWAISLSTLLKGALMMISFYKNKRNRTMLSVAAPASI